MDAVESEELVITNRFSELSRLQWWAETLAARMRLSTKAAFHLDLVLCEAVTNIISYAYTDESEHAVVVRLIDRGDAVVIELTDDGKPFNPLAAEITQLGSELANVAIGGWGIQLIRSYTRDQSYRYAEGKNVLKLEISKDYQHSDSAILS